MVREALVEKRVIGVEQVRDGPVLAEDALDKQLGFPAHCLPEVVVEIDEAPRIRRDGLEAAQVEPLRGEVGDEILRPVVGEHAADLGVEFRGIPQIAARGGVEQRVVGQAAPEKKRKARGQFEIADAVGGAGRNARGVGLDAEEELRAHEDRGERVFDAGLEARALGGAVAEELKRLAQIVVGDGAAIGAAGELGEDRARLRFVGAGGHGRVAENQPPARRVARALGVERSGDGDLENRRRGARVAVHVEARGEGRALGLKHGGGILRERHADVLRTGLHAEAKLEVLVDGLGVLVGAGWLDRGGRDALAVEQDLDVVRTAEALDLLVAVALEAHGDLVVAVLRKQVGNQDAAAGAEGQALDVLLLRDIRPHAKRVAAGRLARRADGEARDFLRGRDVAVEQSGREVADGDIVKAVAGLVVGQKRRGVDRDTEQITDGVLVFGAVEPAEGIGAAGIRRGGRGSIEGAGQGGDHADVVGLAWPRLAERRHLAVLELAGDVFPRGGGGGDFRGLEALEREPAFLRARVMAIDAVFREQRVHGFGGRRGGGKRRTRPREEAGGQGSSDRTRRGGAHRVEGGSGVRRR